MTPQQQITEYLSRFEASLKINSRSAKDDIVRELRAHIRDAVEQQNTDAATVLNRLGKPDILARQYRDSLLLQNAGHSMSPVLLLRAALRLATKGVFGIVVLACGVFGYAFGAGFVMVGLIKPFAPAHTGLWLQDGVVVSSGALVVIPPPPAHDVLGWWIIPAALILGTLVLFVTTLAIRFSLRVSHSWQARLEGKSTLSPV